MVLLFVALVFVSAIYGFLTFEDLTRSLTIDYNNHNYDENKLQSNSVITNSKGPSVSVRYNREIVITVMIYVVKKPDGTKIVCNFCSL